MKRHNRQGQPRFPPKTPFVCSHCKEGECNRCIDVMRVIVSLEPICGCAIPGHDGEPVHNQIVDPITGEVHGPGMIIGTDGKIKRKGSADER